MSLLIGRARASIEGFGPNPANYDAILDRLKSRLDRPDLRRRALKSIMHSYPQLRNPADRRDWLDKLLASSLELQELRCDLD